MLQALSRRLGVTLCIVTAAPAWLFTESLTAPCTIHAEAVDVGLVQQSPLVEDLEATLHALAVFSEETEGRVERIAAHLTGCRLVLCDIAPLGLAAARLVGIPSVLIENFTWDWIYEGYSRQWPQFQPHVAALAALFSLADHRFRTRPFCGSAPCDLVVDPVARPICRPEQLRRRLYLEPAQQLVVLTMGGIGAEIVALQPLLRRLDLIFVLPGWTRENEFTGNLRFLGREASWYHPDLVAAADLVVGKLGYSTVAEAYQAGTPFAYVTRPAFRESADLAAFVAANLPSVEITREQLASGAWLTVLPRMPAKKIPTPHTANGAEQAADYLVSLLAV